MLSFSNRPGGSARSSSRSSRQSCCCSGSRSSTSTEGSQRSSSRPPRRSSCLGTPWWRRSRRLPTRKGRKHHRAPQNRVLVVCPSDARCARAKMHTVAPARPAPRAASNSPAGALFAIGHGAKRWRRTPKRLVIAPGRDRRLLAPVGEGLPRHRDGGEGRRRAPRRAEPALDTANYGDRPLLRPAPLA